MNCRELFEHLSDYVDQELDEELNAAAQEHLGRCQRCRAAVETTQRIITLCGEAYQPQDTSPEQPAARRRWFEQVLAAYRP